MGKFRVCDARCHTAVSSRCECWCTGLFHGQAGEAARDAFRKMFGADPVDPHKVCETSPLFVDTWKEAMVAAYAAPRDASAGDPWTRP